MTRAVLVDNLTKTYQIGARQIPADLRENLSNLFTASWWRRPRQETITVLNDISFRINEGEIVGIIGTNGAGKSTLLKILSRVTYPTAGTMKISGRVSSLLEVGTGFHEELTGRENIFLNGSILGMRRVEIQARFEEIVEYSGVSRFIDTPIKRYSSGMRLRLGFAVAAHLDPDVLIVDEVLAVGDAAFQRKCLRTMQGLREGGRTVLFVSHNMAAVENLCSRAIWLEGGRIRDDAPAKDVIQAYMSANVGAKAGSAVLTDFPGRRGTGNIQLTHIDLLDRSREPLPVIRAGDSLIVRLRYVSHIESPNLIFGFQIMSEMGTLITETSTRMHDVEIKTLPVGVGYLDLEIDALNLMPGSYFLSAGITSMGGPIHETLENCLRLDIEPARSFNAGRITDGRYGLIFFPQRWSLDGMQRDGSVGD